VERGLPPVGRGPFTYARCRDFLWRTLVQETFSARRRPFVVPASLDELDGPSTSGRIVLPSHLDWSSRRSYDLDDPRDRRRVYEIVLREGTLDDLRRYVGADELVAIFDELFLPQAIRDGWRQLITERVA
jgi:hypothetical protein